MKLGPIHVLRDATFRRLAALQDLWGQFSTSLASASREGNPLADRVYDHSHGLTHSPLCARVAPAALPPSPVAGDPADLAAAERVVAAYQRAMKDDATPPTPSMWDRIGAEKGELLAALGGGDVRAVAAALGRMFVSSLIWGLGNVHPDHTALLRSDGPTHLHLLFTDSLVNLAEAIGTARVTSMHQDAAGHLQPLNRDLDPLYEAVVARLGFDPAFPAVGCAFGFRLAGRLVAIDSLVHAYTAHRLRQLGGPGASVFEIGGGYGCLALLARRAGLGPYAIFDLPWVNVLQGYFLIRSLPAGSVRLYGEPAGDVRVLPYWALDAEPDRSCDVLVNTDSMPEMGRATAAGYLPKVRRVTRGVFLSINQEAMAHVAGVGAQNCVRELVEEAGGFAALSRHRAWMRHGYVEEVFRPV